jgi:agmatine deiminase
VTEASETTVRMPAEWDPHDAVWLAWPSHEELWQESLPAVQEAFKSLCRAIVDIDPETGARRGEALKVLVPTAKARADAERALVGLDASFYDIGFGDIWLRDTAPIFMDRVSDGALVAARFRFNGWGGKYVLPYDAEVSSAIAARSELATVTHEFILEGGAIEVDGEGTVLTTAQCLLNPNRNPGLTQADIEARVKRAFGASSVLWVKEGLLNDHTDGHIDTIARFVAPGVVMCMRAESESDPNAAVLGQIEDELRAMKDARGRSLEVITVPSPGLVEDEDGEVMPASYVNFYIGNRAVVVPTYGSDVDARAVEAISKVFAGRKTVGVRAKELLEGGGAFHCISQQQPSPRASRTGEHS